MKYSSIIIALYLLVNLKVSAQISTQPPAQALPHFQFFRFNSRPFTDNDLPKGKILFFLFVDPDCEHCQNAVKGIGEKYPAFKKTSIFIISISDQNKFIQFMNTYGSKLKGQNSVTLLEDKLQQFIERFKPVRYPAMFLYSADKKLLDYEDNPESVFRLVNTINRNAK
jgi:hypothetical protein